MNDEAGPVSEAADRRAIAFGNLVIATLPEQGAWRVHYRNAALTPRSVDLTDSEHWNRFEVLKPGPKPPGAVYSGSERRGSFAEVLAHLRLPQHDVLEQLAATALGTDSDSPIADEWASMGFDPPGTVSADWCAKRQISRLAHQPAQAASYVDVEHHESMAALNIVCRNLLIRQKAVPLNVSLLRSTQRELTCGIATEVATSPLTLANGSRVSGFRYLSQHSTHWECWVTWPIDDYSNLQVEEVEDVAVDDEDLIYILTLFELTIAGQ